MKARGSYLRSMTDGANSPAFPALRPPAVPLWPVRGLEAESYVNSVAPEITPREKTRAYDTLPHAESLNLAAPITAKPIANRNQDAGFDNPTRTVSEKVEPAPKQDAQPLHSAHWAVRVPESKHPEREPQGVSSQAQKGEVQASAPRADTSSDSAAKLETPRFQTAPRNDPIRRRETVVMPSRDSLIEPVQELANRTGSVINEIAERGERNIPPRPASATQIQLESPSIAERAIPKPAATSSARFTNSREQEKAQRNSVHIGKIDIHIAPPPAPAVSRRSMRQMPGNSGAALARGFLSSFGLRQG